MYKNRLGGLDIFPTPGFNDEIGQFCELSGESPPTYSDALAVMTAEAHRLAIEKAIQDGEPIPGIFNFELPPYTES